jgi:Domain of unknown function (DUF4389)
VTFPDPVQEREMTDESLSRQPVFDITYQQRQSRLTTFFRGITAIPGVLLLSLWSIALVVTVPIAWFALLFTGRYPRGLYDFHASFARYATYVYSYLYLATDHWPGFSGAPDVDYPVHLQLGEPLDAYSRVKVFFRLIIGIPVYLISYAMAIVVEIGAVIAWFAIVITGREPEGIFQMLRLGLSYQHRAMPYWLLLTEDWPEFTQEDDRQALAGPAAPALPASGAPSAPPAQAAEEAPDLGGFEPPSVPPSDPS